MLGAGNLAPWPPVAASRPSPGTWLAAALLAALLLLALIARIRRNGKIASA